MTKKEIAKQRKQLESALDESSDALDVITNAETKINDIIDAGRNDGKGITNHWDMIEWCYKSGLAMTELLPPLVETGKAALTETVKMQKSALKKFIKEHDSEDGNK